MSYLGGRFRRFGKACACGFPIDCRSLERCDVKYAVPVVHRIDLIYPLVLFSSPLYRLVHVGVCSGYQHSANPAYRFRILSHTFPSHYEQARPRRVRLGTTALLPAGLEPTPPVLGTTRPNFSDRLLVPDIHLSARDASWRA